MSKSIAKADGRQRGAIHKTFWRKLIAKELEQYRELLADDPFADWSRLLHPEIAVEEVLISGLDLLSGDAPRGVALEYFRRGVKIGTRVITENICRRRSFCNRMYPVNLGLVRRAMSYCQLFLGDTLDAEAARQSASEITQFYTDRDEGWWSEFAQQHFIGGAVLLLVAKQFDAAAGLIRLGWKCPSHASVWKQVRDIGQALAAGTPVPRSTRVAFAKVLEAIRRPLRSETIPAFELHLLEQLLVPPTATLDPFSAVARMSR